MKIALNMIVRNESARIERCLKSVIPHISAAVITDTGSTDDTISVMERLFAENKIPFEIHHTSFKDFSQARNHALNAARLSALDFDYILLTDADMELVVEDKHVFDNLSGPSYDIDQRAGSLVYINRRIVSRYTSGVYRGVTHEYLDVASAGTLRGVYFLDHADGANRVNKLERDIALLIEDLKRDPNNDRSWFYLAQSYRENGQWPQAAQAYLRRFEMGGWDQERWNSLSNYAFALQNQGDEGGFILNSLKAYNFRPSRAEPLYDIAKFFRERGDNYTSLLFSEAGMEIPLSEDGLFVNQYVYNTGLKEEFSICAFYHPDKRAKGYKVTNDLILDKKTPDYARDTARRNMFFYLEPLSKFAPSFKATKLGFVPPDGYTPLNPSIATAPSGHIYCVIRTVNYTIDAAGRYLIRSTNGEANSTNPIDTRNFLARLRLDDFDIQSISEIVWSRSPPAFDLVTGMEDMRLSAIGSRLTVNACVREQNPQGWCRQVQAEIRNEAGSDYVVGQWHTMMVHDRHEKNWMPIQGRNEYVYQLDRIVNDLGKTVKECAVDINIDRISGGSQLIPFFGGLLAVVHEASFRPDNGQRYYQHRFALFDKEGNFGRLSLPFYLHDKQIEFVAGLCWGNGKLLISYGVRDEEAWIAELDAHDVMGILL